MRILILAISTLLISRTVLGQDEETISSQTAKVRPAYFCEPTGGFLAGDNVGAAFHLKNGFTFQNRLDLSLGLGIEGQGYGSSLPFFLESRYNFLQGKTSPFVSLSGGYLHVIRQNYYYYGQTSDRMSFTGGAKIGIKHKVTSNVSIVSAIGYRFTHMREVYEVQPWDSFYYPSTYFYNMNRFELSFGLFFN